MIFKRIYEKMTQQAFFANKPVEESAAPQRRALYYRLIWLAVVATTNIVALVPLIVMANIDHKTTEKAIVTEFRLRAARLVSNTSRSLKFLLTERQAALHFATINTPSAALKQPEKMKVLLQNLRESFGGGFEDIGLIDSSGNQISYYGPYDLIGKNYYGQPWFEKVVEQGDFVSNVFLGFRQKPHLAIAVKKQLDNGSFEILRTTMSIDLIERALAEIEIGGGGEAFIINESGILQTDTRNYGKVLETCRHCVPEYSDFTQVKEYKNSAGEPLIVGYRYVDRTPFILMVVKEKKELMKPWAQTRQNLFFFLFVSICMVLLVTWGTATLLVRKIYVADSQRELTFQQIGHNEKMASIGRLAANVSHEINNPLAIINEKAGLIKDIFEIKKEYQYDRKLIENIDSILVAVKRASKITRRLLSFARHMESSNEIVELETVVKEVLGFLEKEAELKSIDIQLDVQKNLPAVESDRGALQQIFVNIINNAFDAMDDKGILSIRIGKKSPTSLVVQVSDNGPGIPEHHLANIFEPFFTTKSTRGGTGLGLVVTYNLVQEIGGSIDVESRKGIGTTFSVSIPLKAATLEEEA
jgi:signal transduction histidine kinase